MKPTRTLLRGLEVMEVLSRASEPVGPTRVAELVGLDKATVGRLLHTLCEAGYARQNDSGAYQLTAKIMRLASGATLQPGIRELAHGHLLALRDVTSETVHLGIRDDDQVIYIDKIDGTHPVRLVSAIGQTMPLHTTALGKVALAWMAVDEREKLLARLPLTARTEFSIVDLDSLRAELDRTRARGYAIDDRENEDHARCVGAPIVAQDGEVVAMISVSGPSYRVTDADRVADLGMKCRDTAAIISGEFGRTGTI
ncbi:IclR family transcriptional regulator [Natronosporangium hydrolyticum]|uniref:IclR family transcriptional regulator n=1 Tax=Natronosporangium hydrolyticum TaxID=2811111 RepID=A0A895YN62_9ACTN|nr:IclR family transcriptional regulator [Natronosporangium hydrolyticum]QSB15368.1 IclR family transcriptional regulator [Natronosporangium hydrolyticum]